MKVKIKSQIGTPVVSCSSDSITLKKFIHEVELAFGGALDTNAAISLKNGFPPKVIDMAKMESPISELGIKNGDQLILEGEGVSTNMSDSVLHRQSVAPTKHKSDPTIPSIYIELLDKYLILRNIPDDNSCMFNSISYGVFGCNSYDRDGVSPPSNLRSIISNTIKNHQDTYNEVVLGQSVDQYCKWILKKDSWGGAIELGILADWFDIRINCLDIELGKFIRFENELKKPDKFIILIYLGIHYDILSLNVNLSSSVQDKQIDQCVWPLNTKEEAVIIESSYKLCLFLQTQNYSTNTTTFRIRCLDCYKVLIGESGASKHANETGHFNFGEVK